MHVDCLDALAIHHDGQSLAARLLRPRAIEHRAATKGDPGCASRNPQKMSSGGHFPSWSILICSREHRRSGKTGSNGIFAALVAEISKTGAPVKGPDFAEAVRRMQRTEPNYSACDLAEVHVPILGMFELNELIMLPLHDHLARSIPEAEFILLPGVSHFAPLQRPQKFNSVMLAFLGKLLF
jgi:hypothetical protein